MPDTFLFQRKMVFHALRGKLSSAKAEKLLGRSLEIPLGDGGLLMAGLLEKRPQKKYRLGIIPHVVDRENPVFARLAAGVPRAQIIDVRESPVVLETIASCDCIVSTAMHSLIAADSLGIPNRWIEVSDLVQGNGYKFRRIGNINHLFASRQARQIGIGARGRRPDMFIGYLHVPDLCAFSMRLHLS